MIGSSFKNEDRSPRASCALPAGRLNLNSWETVSWRRPSLSSHFPHSISSISRFSESYRRSSSRIPCIASCRYLTYNRVISCGRRWICCAASVTEARGGEGSFLFLGFWSSWWATTPCWSERVPSFSFLISSFSRFRYNSLSESGLNRPASKVLASLMNSFSLSKSEILLKDDGSTPTFERYWKKSSASRGV